LIAAPINVEVTDLPTENDVHRSCAVSPRPALEQDLPILDHKQSRDAVRPHEPCRIPPRSLEVVSDIGLQRIAGQRMNVRPTLDDAGGKDLLYVSIADAPLRRRPEEKPRGRGQRVAAERCGREHDDADGGLDQLRLYIPIRGA
jgi:hypothetical protein